MLPIGIVTRKIYYLQKVMISHQKHKCENGSQVQYYDMVWLSTSPTKELRSKWVSSSVDNPEIYL